MTVLFGRHSIWKTLLACGTIVRAQRILFFPPHDLHGGREAPVWIVRTTLRLIRWLNPRAQVSEVPQEIFLPLWHKNNEASAESMERLFHSVNSSVSFQRMSALIESDCLERYYKLRLLPELLSQTLFHRTAAALKREGRLVLLPERLDEHPLAQDASTQAMVPVGVRFWLRAAHLLRRTAHTLGLINVFRLFAFSVHPILEAIFRGGVHRSSTPIQTDVAMPLTSGFRDPKQPQFAGHDDGLLLGGDLTPERVLFCRGDWHLSAQALLAQRRRMQEQGIRYVNPEQLPVGRAGLIELAGLCLRSWSLALRPLFWVEEPRFAAASAALIRTYLKELRFARTVSYKVWLEYQDYSPAHVVRSIVARQLNRLTLGMHHGNPIAPQILPGMRYTTIHRLCVWGKGFSDLFGSHWAGMRQLPIGAYRADLILRAQREPARQELLKACQRQFGTVRPRILLLLPNLQEWFVLRSRAQALLEGLRRLKSLTGNFQVVCRFRSETLKRQWLAFGLEEILAQDARITSDAEWLDTYAWMSVSDLVIGGSHTTGLLEAAVAGIPCAAFDHMGTADSFLGQYNRAWVLKSGDDVAQAVERLLKNAWPKAGLERLAKDFSFFSDGKSIERLRAEIMQAVRDVEGTAREDAPSAPASPFRQDPILVPV